jgi:hypothetical protein
MAKIIDKGLISKDDPAYSDGWIIGPVLVSRKSAKSGKSESKPGKDQPKKKK